MLKKVTANPFIGILAGVLVPTFTGIVNKAKASARMQVATNTYHAAIAYAEEGTYASTANPDAYIEVEENGTNYYFSVEDGKVTALENAPTLTNYTEVVMEENTGAKFYKYVAPTTNP